MGNITFRSKADRIGYLYRAAQQLALGQEVEAVKFLKRTGRAKIPPKWLRRSIGPRIRAEYILDAYRIQMHEFLTLHK